MRSNKSTDDHLESPKGCVLSLLQCGGGIQRGPYVKCHNAIIWLSKFSPPISEVSEEPSHPVLLRRNSNTVSMTARHEGLSAIMPWFARANSEGKCSTEAFTVHTTSNLRDATRIDLKIRVLHVGTVQNSSNRFRGLLHECVSTVEPSMALSLETFLRCHLSEEPNFSALLRKHSYTIGDCQIREAPSNNNRLQDPNPPFT